MALQIKQGTGFELLEKVFLQSSHECIDGLTEEGGPGGFDIVPD